MVRALDPVPGCPGPRRLGGDTRYHCPWRDNHVGRGGRAAVGICPSRSTRRSLTAFLAHVPFDPLDPGILPLIRLPIVLMAAAAAPLTYVWGRPLWGHKAAVLAALLLALDPFLLALSRVLGHDALVAVFMWLSLLAFLRAANQLLISHLQSPISNPQSPNLFDRRYVIISGALGDWLFSPSIRLCSWACSSR